MLPKFDLACLDFQVMASYWGLRKLSVLCVDQVITIAGQFKTYIYQAAGAGFIMGKLPVFLVSFLQASE